MNTVRAWQLLSTADRLSDERLDEVLRTLAHGRTEQRMLARIEHAPEPLKPLWRNALATRLRRRLLIPFHSAA